MKRGKSGTDEERVERLLSILQFNPTADDCQTCLNQLDDYISMQLAGEDYGGHFPEVANHLDACAQCAQAYARLYELAIADAANRLPQAPSMPDPDLGFLQADSSTQVQASRLSERLLQALQQTTEKLTLYLSVDLLDMLLPMTNAIPQMRSPANSERYTTPDIHPKEVFHLGREQLSRKSLCRTMLTW